MSKEKRLGMNTECRSLAGAVLAMGLLSLAACGAEPAEDARSVEAKQGALSPGRNPIARWVQRPGTAKDIGAATYCYVPVGNSFGPVVFIVSDEVGVDGFKIKKWNGSGFVTIPMSGVRVAVETTDPSTPTFREGRYRVWVVTASGNIYMSNDNAATSWTMIGGPLASDIGAGYSVAVQPPRTAVWMVGRNPLGGGNQVYQYNTVTGWVPSTGGGVRVGVSAAGRPWVVTSSGEIFRYSSTDAKNGSWTKLNGSASDIAPGHSFKDLNGYDWVTWKGSQVARFLGAAAPLNLDTDQFNADQVATSAGVVGIATDSTANPWVVDGFGRIYQGQ